MKILTFIFCVMAFITSFAQIPVNLLPNPSFENGNMPDDCSIHDRNALDFNNNEIASWRLADPHPDIFNTDVPSPDWLDVLMCSHKDQTCHGITDPDLTKRFIGMGGGEGIRGMLPYDLPGNKKYKIRAKLRMIQYNDFPNFFPIEVNLTNKSEHWNDRDDDNQRMMPATTLGFDNPANDCKWQTCERVFEVPADKGDKMKNIVFWCPGDSRYINLDDVELYEYCTEWMLRQNRLYKLTEKEEAGYIHVGNYVSPGYPAGEVLMDSGSKTIYKAYNDVSMQPGTTIRRGADFLARIAPCGKPCMPPDGTAGSDQALCGGQSVTLGVPVPAFGYTYSWSATPAGALQYLSATNTSNPVFTPPAGQGAVQYTLTITNRCGESTQRMVIIKYDNQPSFAANFSILAPALSSDHPSFAVSVDPHTEEVRIELQDCDGNVINTYAYTNSLDFQNNLLSWQFTGTVNACGCYRFVVKSKNYCSDEWFEQVLDWNRNTSFSLDFISNVVLCGNPTNNFFYVKAKGAKHVKVSIFNEWDAPVYQSESPYLSDPMAFPMPHVSDNSYAYVVEITDCNGNVHTYHGFVRLFGCDDLEDIAADGDDTGLTDIHTNLVFEQPDGMLDSLYSLLTPNPVTEAGNIAYHLPVNGHVKVAVCNANFEQVAVLVNEDQAQGDHGCSISAAEIPFGLNYYMIELTATKVARQVKRFSVIR